MATRLAPHDSDNTLLLDVTHVMQRSTIWFRIILMLVAAAGLVMTCTTIAQETPSPAASTSGASAVPAGNSAAPQGGDNRVPQARSGIPTDPLGIADAMGRPFTVAFIIASVIGVWSVIERLVVLRRRRVIPRGFVERFLMQLRAGRIDRNEAIAICQQNQSPVADVFLHGVRKWGRPAVEVEQAVTDGGERQMAQLRKGLRILNGISTLTPLIGLLGTVVGMIQSFNDIATAGAMGQTQTLANGIALALLTTAVGLFIAIPAMVAYLYLVGRIDSIVLDMDRLGVEIVNLISAEALRERAVAPMQETGPSIPRPRKPVSEMP